MNLKEEGKKIIAGVSLYGALAGVFPPLVFAIVSITAPAGSPGHIGIGAFRNIYYFRIIVSIVLGTLVGGFSSALCTKLGLTIIKDMKWWKGTLTGVLLGGVVGLFTAGSAPLSLLISSTDVPWAFEVIKRSAIMGFLVGAFGGAIAGTIAAVYFNKNERDLLSHAIWK